MLYCLKVSRYFGPVRRVYGSEIHWSKEEVEFKGSKYVKVSLGYYTNITDWFFKETSNL